MYNNFEDFEEIDNFNINNFNNIDIDSFEIRKQLKEKNISFLETNILNNLAYLPKSIAENIKKEYNNAKSLDIIQSEYYIHIFITNVLQYVSNIFSIFSAYKEDDKKNISSIDEIVNKTTIKNFIHLFDNVKKSYNILQQINNVNFYLAHKNKNKYKLVYMNFSLDFGFINSLVHKANKLVADLSHNSNLVSILDNFLEKNRGDLPQEIITNIINNYEFKDLENEKIYFLSDEYTYKLFSKIISTNKDISKKLIEKMLNISKNTTIFNKLFFYIIATPDYNILENDTIVSEACKYFNYTETNNKKIGLIFDFDSETNFGKIAENELEKIRKETNIISNEDLNRALERIKNFINKVSKNIKKDSKQQEKIAKLLSAIYYFVLNNEMETVLSGKQLNRFNEIKNKISALPYGEQMLENMKRNEQNQIKIKITQESMYYGKQ